MKVVKPKMRWKKNPKGKEYGYWFVEVKADINDRYLLKSYEFEEILKFYDVASAFLQIAQEYLIRYVMELELDVKVNRKIIEELSTQLTANLSEEDKRTILMSIRIKQNESEFKIKQIKELYDSLIKIKREFELEDEKTPFDKLIAIIQHIMEHLEVCVA